MDYEKKYKEAIERAKQILNTPYTAHWDIMKELVEYLFPELKKSEDESIIKALVRMVNFFESENIQFMYASKDAILTWLHKQGEQKPAEWSEEDKKMIDAIYSCVDLHYDGLAKTSLLIWLKSLRPQKQWKPTKRQMEVLEDFLFHIPKEIPEKAVLVSLHQELKKL